MSYSIHVNGPALIRFGRQGDGTAHADTPQDLGFTDGGPSIDIEYHKEPVISDNAGPVVPADLQKMGKSAKIVFTAVTYDDAVLTSWLLKDGTVEGQCDMTGQLIFQNDAGFRTIITSPIDGKVWRFHFCSVDYCRLRPGSKYLTYDVSIDAIPYVNNATSLSGKILFDHTNS